MKLTEYKTKTHHYFVDEQDRIQGEYKLWYLSGCQWVICHYRNNKIHGEYKEWDLFGDLGFHTFEIYGKQVINFRKNPELYPTTPEEKTMFVLKYGSGKFIDAWGGE